MTNLEDSAQLRETTADGDVYPGGSVGIELEIRATVTESLIQELQRRNYVESALSFDRLASLYGRVYEADASVSNIGRWAVLLSNQSQTVLGNFNSRDNLDETQSLAREIAALVHVLLSLEIKSPIDTTLLQASGIEESHIVEELRTAYATTLRSRLHFPTNIANARAKALFPSLGSKAPPFFSPPFWTAFGESVLSAKVGRLRHLLPAAGRDIPAPGP